MIIVDRASVLDTFTNPVNAIRCETQEEANTLLGILAEAGIDTPSSDSWTTHEQDTCYRMRDFHAGWCFTDYYTSRGYNIIDFSSLMNTSNVSLLDILTS